jgi:hypothetical protein
MTAPRRSVLGRVLRLYFWALLAALLVGLGIGFWIRHRMEQPRVQMGSAPTALPALAGAAPPHSGITGAAAPTPAPGRRRGGSRPVRG